jgi:uncharacterized protein YndB with AHSA1/START domain
MKGRIDTITRIIKASPSSLYQAYMNPDALVQWMPPSGMTAKIENFNPKSGGGYLMTLTYDEIPTKTVGKTTEMTDTIETKFVELVPDKKVVGSGVFESEDSQYADEMFMTWYFEEIEEGTKVTLVVENVPPGIEKAIHIEGLHSTLENLARFVENQ